MFMHLANKTYSRDGRSVEGTVPAIELSDMNILFVSLGAEPEATDRMRKRVHDALKAETAARELLAALELARMSNGWRYLAPESQQVIDAAIAAARSAGIKGE